MEHVRSALSPADPGQDRALASDTQEPHPARALLPARRSRTPDRSIRGVLRPCPVPRKLANLTSTDVYFGRAETILLERERIKRQTIEYRASLSARSRNGSTSLTALQQLIAAHEGISLGEQQSLNPIDVFWTWLVCQRLAFTAKPSAVFVLWRRGVLTMGQTRGFGRLLCTPF